jgi:hypothetical protein
MGKNQNTGSHRTKIIFCEIKIIFHHFGTLAGEGSMKIYSPKSIISPRATPERNMILVGE